MRLLHLFGTAFVITAACGGSAGSPLDEGGVADDGGDASTSDSASNDGAQKPDSPQGSDGGAPCPNEKGLYAITLTGQGCGDTSTNVQECIQQTACDVSLDFGGGSGKGLKGTTPIQSDGSFTNAAIEEGSANRTGCIGTWDQSTTTLTIVCGGTNTSQSCTATLTRTAEACK